jgi:hypothetical protein
MDQRALSLDRRYLLKHTSHTVPVLVSSVAHRTDIATLDHESVQTLAMNDIGVVHLNLLRGIAFDVYAQDRTTGAFILIDPESNSTVAAGMISEMIATSGADESGDANAWGPVTAAERLARWGHRGGALELTGPGAVIDAVERSLFSGGVISSRIDPAADEFQIHPGLYESVTLALLKSGILALAVRIDEDATFLARIEDKEISVDASDPNRSISAVHQLLLDSGIFISFEKANL